MKPLVCSGPWKSKTAPCLSEWNAKTECFTFFFPFAITTSFTIYPFLPANSIALPVFTTRTQSRELRELRAMATMKKASSVLVAVCVGAVEALKDQAGLCRWNYAVRSLQQHAKGNMGSLSQAVRMPSSMCDRRSSEEAERSEESLRKVMYLSCWGPN